MKIYIQFFGFKFSMNLWVPLNSTKLIILMFIVPSITDSYYNLSSVT
jgi:hypothetical protein